MSRNERPAPCLAIAGVFIGVSIAGAAAGGGGEQAGTPVTFTRDVAPILYTHCVGCHRPDGIGPFSLTTYADARERAPRIAAVTAERRMPPWKPAPGYGRFRHERRLSDAQIALLFRWSVNGAAEGDPADLPEPPGTAGGWQLGPPDLVVTMEAPFRLPSGRDDVYRNFVLPVNLDARRWVRAVEVWPGTGGGRVIHHARILLDGTGAARILDAGDVEPGYDGLMLDHARFPAGHFLGWAPGKTPAAVPEEISWPLDPGTDLVLQLHLLPEREPTDVQPAVGLHFADRPATLTPVSVLLTSKAIRIPAGDPAHVVEDSYQLPIAVDVLGIAPHMHHLGKRVEARATLPDGSEKPLLRIDDWDFDWQDEYRYREPVHLPAGSRLRVRFTFDNSTANPRNPHDPPVTVGFGPGATDEMAELMLQVLPVGDADTLARSLAVKQGARRHPRLPVAAARRSGRPRQPRRARGALSRRRPGGAGAGTPGAGRRPRPGLPGRALQPGRRGPGRREPGSGRRSVPARRGAAPRLPGGAQQSGGTAGRDRRARRGARALPARGALRSRARRRALQPGERAAGAG